MTDQESPSETRVSLPAGLVPGVIGLWLVLALALSLSGSLQASAGAAPLRVLAAAGPPILVFLAWYRGSAAFRGWILGLDLRIVIMLQAWRVVAVATGTLAAGLVPGLVTGVTTAAMSTWPLSVIPGFLVPLFAILHLAAIFQVRARAA